MIEPCIQQTSRQVRQRHTEPRPIQPATTVCLTLASFVCLLSMTNNPDRMIIYRQQLIYCLFFLFIAPLSGPIRRFRRRRRSL